MEGIRIRHATATNARFTIVEKDNPYRRLYQCTPPEFGGCGQLHTHKTHHLTLDETGTCIVARDLYQRLEPLLVANGFERIETIDKPPTMGVGVGVALEGSGAWGNIPIIRGQG